MAITLNGTTGISSPGGDTSTSLATTNLSYTGTLTGGTGVIAIGTNQIYKDASGNVGIGTATQINSGKITVAANIAVSAYASSFAGYSMQASGTGGREYRISSTDNTNGLGGGLFAIYDQTANSLRLSVDSSGNLFLNQGYLSLGNNGYIRADSAGWLQFQGGSSGSRFMNSSNASALMTLDASGRLGIGNTSPQFLFEVDQNTTSASPNKNSAIQVYTRGYGGGGSYYGGIGFAMHEHTNGYWGCGIQSIDDTGSYGAGLAFSTSTGSATPTSTEKVRITSAGDFLVGTPSATANVVFKPSGSGVNHQVWTSASSTNAAYWTSGSGSVNGVATGVSSAACMITVNKDSGNTRSISAAGTINASGADYAEYMTKAGAFEIAKGDICGIDSSGLLTNVFADAISFVVKSTDPSYVGGDSWGAGIEDKDVLEIERQKVDRIAFSGQVPINVFSANTGDYIIPIVDKEGIKGEAVSNPTFEQYQIAVGKVIAIEADGRARIIVKVA